MTKPNILIRSTYLSIVVGFTASILLPIAILTGSASAECVPPPDPGPGIHHPVGADAAAFIYNCDSLKWESAHFVYDPNTGFTNATDPVTYTYNPATRMYDTTSWFYNTTVGAYQQDTKSVTTPPSGATVIGAPVAGTGGNSISNTGAGSNNTINNNGGVASGSSINGTGPGSNNTIGGSANNTLNGNNNTRVGLNNAIAATASTGNSLTLSNTKAGGATSGNAQDIANVVNMLQSSSNALGGDTVTFVANIDGDVNGDLFFDPAAIGKVQPAGVTNAVGDNNLTINNALDTSINNDIRLKAVSGNAAVSGNTTGGDATSGSATTIANVVNLINSAITSGKSFLGVININGNLNGDILVPDDFVEQLIAANVPTVTISTTGPGSNNAITENNGSNNTTVNNTNHQGITNNVNATAASGQANVSENTSAGNATSGTADTSITAFNLTGNQVIGRNSILVFVNVVGQWVGLIVNAPAGATAAELGGGITQNSTSPANNNTTVNNDTNQRINNNITTDAQSGSATVSRNTLGGNAKSGNAKGAVNLLNVQNSSLSLSNYFGILFINVFGTWHGSFGVNTAAGNPIARGQAGSAGTPGASFAPTQFASFIPKRGNAQFTVTGGANGLPTVSGSGQPSTNATPAVNAVLAASAKVASTEPQTTTEHAQSNFRRTAAIIMTCVILFILGDAYFSRLHANKVGKA